MLNKKTPAQVTKWLETNLHKFENPACYLGGEPNTYSWTDKQWNDAKLRVLLTTALDYMQAVGNITMPLLYQLSNEYNHETRITERCYPPSSRRELEMLEKAGMAPWGLETRHCAGDYDVIGASISYSPYWFNVVKTLKMAGIPIRWKDRLAMKEQYPLVIVGGHDFASPWFMAPVVDMVWCGEAEDEQGSPGLNAFLDDLAKCKAAGIFYDSDGREKMLHKLATKYPHIFVPRFYTLNHEKKGKSWAVTGWNKKYDDLPDRIRKRIVRDLDAVEPTTRPPVPFHDPSLGMGTIQVSRGCTYHCGFCAATYRECPYRERSQQVAHDKFAENVKWTGSPEISPLTLEFGTYSRKKALMKQCLEDITPEFSMPSLRVDVFGADPTFGAIAVHGHKKNATLAVEGNSQKLRELVSKGIQEEDILKAFSNAIAAGYESAKFYQICNLPGENGEDHEELYQLALKLDQIRRSTGSGMRMRFSWKPLTVQAWTPFQWFPCKVWSASMSDILRKIQALGFGTQIGDETKQALGNYIQLAEIADDIAGEALTDVATISGATTYGVLPKSIYEMIVQQLAKRGRTLDDYYREKDFDEVFAWDIIDALVTKEYLLRVHKLMRKRIESPKDTKLFGHGFVDKFGSCAIGCAQCGACPDDEFRQTTMHDFALREDEAVQVSDIRNIDKQTIRQKFIVWVDMEPSKRFATKDFWQYAIRRACNLADLSVSLHSIRFVTARIKTLKQWFAGRDYFELGFVEPIPKGKFLTNLLNPNLEPFGMRIVKAEEILPTEKLEHKGLEAVLWQHELDLPARHLAVAAQKALTDEYTELSYKIYKYRVGEKVFKINLREVLFDAFVALDGRRANLITLLHPNISPYDAANAIFQQRTDVFQYPAIAMGALTGIDSIQDNALLPSCEVCGRPIPNEMSQSFHPKYCPRHFYFNQLKWKEVTPDGKLSASSEEHGEAKQATSSRPW